MFTHRVEDRLRDTQKLLGVDIKRPEVRLLEEERNEAPLCEGRQKWKGSKRKSHRSLWVFFQRWLDSTAFSEDTGSSRHWGFSLLSRFFAKGTKCRNLSFLAYLCYATTKKKEFFFVCLFVLFFPPMHKHTHIPHRNKKVVSDWTSVPPDSYKLIFRWQKWWQMLSKN